MQFLHLYYCSLGPSVGSQMNKFLIHVNLKKMHLYHCPLGPSIGSQLNKFLIYVNLKKRPKISVITGVICRNLCFVRPL